MATIDTSEATHEDRFMPREHVRIAVSWNDGRTVLLDVTLAESLAEDRRKYVDEPDELYPLDLDQLDNDDSFHAFVREVTRHARNADVVRAVTLDAWRGKLLERLHITGEPPDPIPYDAEGD